MTFNAYETGLDTGKPVRLYDFSYGTTHWRYTSASVDVAYGGYTWESVAISDDGIRQTGETSAEALAITAPRDIAPAQKFIGITPTREIAVKIRDLHQGDGEAIICWVGHVQQVGWPEIDRCKITCQSLSASMARNGLRLCWMRSCPHTLGDSQCRVLLSSYKVSTSVQSFDGSSITTLAVATQAEDYYSAGYIEWVDAWGATDQRMIELHSGSTLQLLGGTSGLSLGLSINVFPGCARIAEVCNIKFNNMPNYGGHPYIPGESPFDGSMQFR
jgi:uncharacterized phage protein (TIGR02218 family)